MIDVRRPLRRLSRHEFTEKLRSVSCGLIGQPHPFRTPLNAERTSVSRGGFVAEGAQPDRQKGFVLRVVAIAPLEEVDAMRVFVLVDVAVYEPIGAATRFACGFLDRWFRRDADRSHAARVARLWTKERRCLGGHDSVGAPVGARYAHQRPLRHTRLAQPRGSRVAEKVLMGRAGLEPATLGL